MPALTAEQPRTRWLVPGIAMLCIACLTVMLLRLEGQRWWCACGETRLWVGNVWTNHCSRHLADAYTLTHFSHGIIFFTVFHFIAKRFAPKWSIAWRLCAAIALAAAWEVFENSEFVISRYRDNTMSVEYLGDSVINSLGDIAACVLGFFFTKRCGILPAIITFIAIEVALMLMIRDNLTVGTLMLIFPIDAIKQWQMAANSGA